MALVIMNIFHVKNEKAELFEKRCRRPQAHLDEVPGLEDFRLLRGKTHGDKVSYMTHATWSSLEALEAWKHAGHIMQSRHIGRLPASLIIGRPRRRYFVVVDDHLAT